MKFAEWLMISESAKDRLFQAILEDPGTKENYLVFADSILDEGDPNGFGEKLARVAQGLAPASSLNDEENRVQVVPGYVHATKNRKDGETTVEHYVVRGSAVRRFISRWASRDEGGVSYFYNDKGMVSFSIDPQPRLRPDEFPLKDRIWGMGSPRDIMDMGVEMRLLLLAGMAELAK